MQPTINHAPYVQDEIVLVNRIHAQEPARGAVVLFEYVLFINNFFSATH